jgi:hypothetical protein
MNTGTKLPAAMLLLATPLAAYAEGGAPHILLFSFGGGFAGGLLGALLACWLCKRARASKDDTGSRDARKL